MADTTEQHEPQQTNGRWKVEPAIALQILAMIIGAAITYSAINARVSVVESKQIDSDHRMERIENKIDTLLRRREP